MCICSVMRRVTQRVLIFQSMVLSVFVKLGLSRESLLLKKATGELREIS